MGLQAAPLAVLPKASLSLPDGLQQDATHPDVYETAADGFRQGTEPSRRLLVDLNTGLVKEHIGDMNRRAFIRPSDGKAVMEQRLADDVLIDAPVERNGGGWVRMEEPSSHLPHGFSQGTEPKMSMPEGFSQGTEPKMLMPEGFSRGTEPKVSMPEGFSQGTEPKVSMPEGFSQGTEPKVSMPEGFSQGTEPKVSMPEGFSQGTEPKVSMPEGFSQGTEPKMLMPEGFSQGTEPKMLMPEGFSRGTEPKMLMPEGFSRGTEPKVSVPKDFRQGTEPSFHIPEGFRQGTENLMSVPVGFRQGTEPSSKIPESFKSRTEPSFNIPEGFRQGTEPILLLAERTQDTKAVPGLLTPRHQPQICKGEIISGRCYEFNPTPLAFQDAQVMCRGLAPNAELASISNNDVHTRLVSLVTNGGNSNPVLTWIGGIDQQASWVDGSEWNYSDWMPGHPNVHSGRQACVEMFNIDESWWTANDCGLKRASICSYPITA
ncbi:hypothetical protein D4764_03G0010870 [Takifugu flavidus]|uniref:C-type lectin domain-containing protein n=1 Tax=Takifugu flavidus TaxID=433684 RepID=A0A5C6NB72_9TELE|nr:hypothetical protein D4764_03G0010870 [Takifugu flavidus]